MRSILLGAILALSVLSGACKPWADGYTYWFSGPMTMTLLEIRVPSPPDEDTGWFWAVAALWPEEGGELGATPSVEVYWDNDACLARGADDAIASHCPSMDAGAIAISGGAYPVIMTYEEDTLGWLPIAGCPYDFFNNVDDGPYYDVPFFVEGSTVLAAASGGADLPRFEVEAPAPAAIVPDGEFSTLLIDGTGFPEIPVGEDFEVRWVAGAGGDIWLSIEYEYCVDTDAGRRCEGGLVDCRSADDGVLLVPGAVTALLAEEGMVPRIVRLYRARQGGAEIRPGLGVTLTNLRQCGYAVRSP